MLPTTSCRCFATTRARLAIATPSMPSSPSHAFVIRRTLTPTCSTSFTLLLLRRPGPLGSVPGSRTYATRGRKSQTPRAALTREPHDELAGDDDGKHVEVETSGRRPSRTTPATTGDYGKIQTVPFHLAPARALQICSTAAHSAFGLGPFLRLIFNRFMHRFFGISNTLETGVERIAFRAVLLPVWRADLAMKGTAWLDAQMNLSVSAKDASIPGFRLSPLDQLVISPPWDTDPVAFSPDEHAGSTVIVRDPSTGERVESEAEEDKVALTVIPFTHHPLNLLKKIARLPRTIESQHGIGLDPSSFKTVLFGVYPLYLPIYLAEYAQDSRRATIVAFGSSEGVAFSMYPSSDPDPSWQPNGDACELTVGGSPVDFTQRPKPNALQALKPKLDQWFSNLQPQSASSPLTLTDPIAPSTWAESIAPHPRVLEYTKHADESKAYMNARQTLDTVEALYESVEALDEDVKGLIIGPMGRPKIAGRDVLVEDVKQQVKKAQREVELALPRWVREVEEKGAR